MTENPDIVGSFDDFSKELNEDKEESVPAPPNTIELNSSFDEKKYIEDQILVESIGLNCAFCDWSGHSNAKDKKRGLRNHMRKCSKNPAKEQQEIPSSPVPKPKPKKKMNIEILPPKVEKIIEEVEMINLSNNEKKEKLIGDLDILKIKFDTIPFHWNYNNNSSVAHLQRQKALFMRVLNDTAGTQAMFKLLVLGSRAIEKIGDVSNVVDLEGYASDVNSAEDEIYPILKNLVDTGVLSVSHLTPELRLGMVMGSLAISRIEKNKVRNRSFLEKEENAEWQ